MINIGAIISSDIIILSKREFYGNVVNREIDHSSKHQCGICVRAIALSTNEALGTVAGEREKSG